VKKTEQMVCIMCPVGCRIEVALDENGQVIVSGYRCQRGVEYGRQEMIAPHRILTTSVLVENGEMELVSVKTNKPVPRKLLFQLIDALKRVRVKAPVYMGDVLVENILNTGADVVATRTVLRKDS